MPKNEYRYSCSDSSYSSDEESSYTCKKCKKQNTCKNCERQNTCKKKDKICKKCKPKRKSCSKCDNEDNCEEEEDEDKPLDICDPKKNGNYIIITIK